MRNETFKEFAMQNLNKVVAGFHLPKAAMLEEAQAFAQAMAAGLAGGHAPLAMLPSYLSLPSGQEQGEFLALDFGGSNIRIARIRLAGRTYECSGRARRPLGEFLLEEENMDGERLFFRLACFISEFAKEKGGFLGHTFSYPVKQSGPNSAVLQKWTKEMQLPGLAEVAVNELLAKQLTAAGRADIKPVVLLNDTTAVLLAAAYAGGGAPVGSVCGTGHNSCYYEPARGMVINIESGNYQPLVRNIFDRELDEESSCPGQQWLEKMTAGNYLARLVVLAARAAKIDCPQLATAKELSVCLLNGGSLYDLAASVIERAARLLAAEYFGINLHLATSGGKVEGVAIDGSVYNNLPLFQEKLQTALAELFISPPRVIAADGSSLFGAAVAAATCVTRGWT